MLHLGTHLCISLVVKMVVRVDQEELLQAEGGLLIAGPRERERTIQETALTILTNLFFSRYRSASSVQASWSLMNLFHTHKHLKTVFSALYGVTYTLSRALSSDMALAASPMALNTATFLFHSTELVGSASSAAS